MVAMALCLMIVDQISEKILYFVVEEPNLAHRCFGTYFLRKVCSALKNEIK